MMKPKGWETKQEEDKVELKTNADASIVEPENATADGATAVSGTEQQGDIQALLGAAELHFDQDTEAQVPAKLEEPKKHVAKAKELAPLDEREEILEYKPFASTESWFAYRFSGWNSPKAWFAMALVVIFFGAGFHEKLVRAITQFLLKSPDLPPGMPGGETALTSSALIIQIFVWFIASVFVLINSVYLRQPNQIALTPEGIRMRWRNRFVGKLLGNMPEYVAWKDIELVDLRHPEGKASPQDYKVCFKSRHQQEGYALQLKLGAITTQDDRYRLLRAIEFWAPEAHKDAQLLETLTPPQDHSYTELWLQALSAPPKRERLTPLNDESELFNKRFEVKRQLGVGGQGTAYLAYDRTDKHEVVLKEFILPVYVDTNVLRQALERMQNEAAILRKLDNPHIVRLNHFFVEDHRGYLVLERINGDSLDMLVGSNGPMQEDRVIGLAQQMCLMLEYLHGLEPPVIHRDFTPDNLILDDTDTLKLVDFNVAQQTESTATGTVVGKHSYISPEQFRGRPTPQSDIYSMGATLFYLLTGEAPEPIRVSHPAKTMPMVSKSLDNIVARATAFDTAKRYAKIQDLAEDLRKLAAGEEVE